MELECLGDYIHPLVDVADHVANCPIACEIRSSYGGDSIY
jgi:hypothetical protein